MGHKAARQKSAQKNFGANSLRANTSAPSQVEVESLVALFNQGQFNEGEVLARDLVVRFPNDSFGWKVLGAMLKSQGRSNDAHEPMRRAAELAPRDEQAHSNLGVVLADLKQWDAAAKCQRRALQLSPNFAEAHFNLGNAMLALQRLAEAEASYARAAHLKPEFTRAHRNLGQVLAALGKYAAAELSFSSALKASNDTAETAEILFHLGGTRKEQARYAEAADTYRQALQYDSQSVDALNNLGIVLKYLGNLQEAEQCYRRALQIQPDCVEAAFNLGINLSEQARNAEAEQSYLHALEIKPDYAEAHNNLGNIYETQRRFDAAEVSHRRAIAINNRYADAYCNLGNALRGQGKLAEAEACYRQALAESPTLAAAAYNLGIALGEQARLVEAEQSYRNAIELKPDYAEAHKNLANTLTAQGRFAEAEISYRQALTYKPDYVDALSNLLFDLNYTESRSIEECVQEARRFGELVQSKATCRYSRWRCDPNAKRLRVGLVSGDFRNHPVGFLVEAALAHVDPQRVELFAYSAHHEQDDVTARIKSHVSQFRVIAADSDAIAAQKIYDDSVHVLLDLSGHTASNRLPMFAFKPAPLQATWLGYFATTGVPEMDYILGDPHVTPPHEQGHFTEQVWRFPETYACFTDPGVDLPVSLLPALANQRMTFGCFNNLTKMTDAVVAVWSRILHAMPNSILLLKTGKLNDAATREKTLARFAMHGISAQRLVLEGSVPRREILAAYGRIDVALDPFPYPGGTTSVESLWMGVPFITKRGERFNSHMGERIANNAGLAEWVAADDDDYVAKATLAAADLENLSVLRARLRSQVLASPLFDAVRFARNFENALWGMWQHSPMYLR